MRKYCNLIDLSNFKTIPLILNYAGFVQEARKLSIQRCIQSLVHACQCRDANCRLPSCQKMKRVVQHTKICKRKANGDCPICKQLIALCCYHAKYCQVAIAYAIVNLPLKIIFNPIHKILNHILHYLVQQYVLLLEKAQ